MRTLLILGVCAVIGLLIAVVAALQEPDKPPQPVCVGQVVASSRTVEVTCLGGGVVRFRAQKHHLSKEQ